jgi:hypothetical protein
MQFPVSPNQRILWGIIILIVLGYLGGNWLNRRRSRAIGKWLQSALGSLGGQPAWNLIGTMSSGVQLTVNHATRPFRQFTITYHMLTREFLPLWILELLRGKRDLMSLRGDLRGSLNEEIEVVPMRSSLRRTLDQHAAPEDAWHWQAAPARLGLATHEAGDSPLCCALLAFLEQYGRSVERLSLRRRQPNLIMFVKLNGIEKAPAIEFLQALHSALAPSTSSERRS